MALLRKGKNVSLSNVAAVLSILHNPEVACQLAEWHELEGEVLF